ncbi:hypothetical protein V6N12_069685 [Hibiscus sabdariffa]|uniref:Uncharacterized protein n=1 Tax=Hibiscus sabdariffa TaxID=183260 RepID=A0ABR2FEJ8_9ROSI
MKGGRKKVQGITFMVQLMQLMRVALKSIPMDKQSDMVNGICEEITDITPIIAKDMDFDPCRAKMMMMMKEGYFAKTRQLTQLLRNGACRNDLNHGSRFVH